MDTPLIAGAGPVGLAAALFLARRGIRTRLIDKATAPSATSRALAVNPRTLHMLEGTGVTEAMLARGQKITEARLYREDRLMARIPLNSLGGDYPFMLGLSQAASEALLAEALVRAGVGRIERGVELVGCAEHEGMDITLAAGGETEIVRPAWILGADGAHSTVRECLHIGFPGHALDEPFSLVDVPLEGDIDPQAAHIRLFDDGGFLFLVRTVADARTEKPPYLWRLIGNAPDLFAQLGDLRPAGPVAWSSSFHVAHRIADHFRRGKAYLAGDAAHIHSPIGARGMNLGIEDAWVFAELAARGRLSHYENMRRHVDHEVVQRVEALTALVLGRQPWLRGVRDLILPAILNSPLRIQVLRTLAGLDHNLAA
jgi:2-polyprenyl-6-methoxyphenol hydroxylase-like FAD-dependent oxidoreductase